MLPTIPTTTSGQPIVWDYNLSGGDLRSTHPEVFDQSWTLSRLLQHHSFYEVINAVPFAVLQHYWPTIKPTVMSKSLREAYEYYINKVVSATR
ncbi:MAG: hypothetical protein A3A82_00355 [Candidatus Pacebacteria bacterium RIFCSPLOWO2_01_FULL_47_12]|nr:MAG: hypothetical protein A3J60_00660 [Candidatus Pacebacteria bacterium RIFCSPHIGHO2_02_FULL_46_9]OGJ39241.1 MAG: hypothetical protein A3A82_00355 [Candidatus Pacebacteria bacterium RIFCSPLOWO2_01_FULL_47_12]